MVWRLHEYASHKNLLEDLTQQVSEQFHDLIPVASNVEEYGQDEEPYDEYDTDNDDDFY